MKKIFTSHLITIVFIALGISARLLPHPANFTPLGAIALCAGMYLTGRQRYLVPLAAMFSSDIMIGFYDWRVMVTVYGSFIISVLIGSYLMNKKQFWFIVFGTTLGSIIFFLTTNAGVWAFGSMYPHTLSGLGQSYFMAIPFFRNSLMGDFFFMAIFVSLAQIATYLSSKPHGWFVRRILFLDGKCHRLGGQ